MLMLAAWLLASGASLVVAQAAFPLYTLGPNSTEWLRKLPQNGSGLTAYSGDIRARMVVGSPLPQHVHGNNTVTAQIFWRRRDARPDVKSVVVTDATGKLINSTSHLVEAACGVISFSAPKPGVYFAYYLPYRRGGSDAWLQFQWYGCDTEAPDCVLSSAVHSPALRGSSQAQAQAPPTCEAVMPPMGVAVTGLENRPNAVAEKDHAVDGTPFNGFTRMELTALPSELATLPRGLNLFLEARENMVRMFHAPTAHWARGGEVLALSLAAREAEFFTFQVGLFANGAPASDVRVTFHGATLVAGERPALAAITPDAFTCFNLGGVDQHGHAFRKAFSLAAGDTGSLWIGVDLPAGAAGKYNVALTVGTNTSAPRTLQVELGVAPGAVADHGDDDVYSLSRLRWLDSAIGVDGEAVWPRSRFANITSGPGGGSARQGGGGGGGGGGGFLLGTVNKDITIGAGGLPSRVTVRTVKQRQGKNVTRSVQVLAEPVQLVVLDAHGTPIDLVVTAPATVTNRTAAAVSWTSTHGGGGVQVVLTGRLDMDSYLTFEALVSAATAAATAVSDVRLVVAAEGSVSRRMLGMGSIGAPAGPLEWQWEKRQGVGNNRLWLGGVDAGVFVTPRGAGDDWVSPTYGKDYPIYPFLPSSWAGVGAAGTNSSIYGANVTLQHAAGAARNATPAAVVCTIFSGPRTLGSTPTQFLFDMMFTPSHPLDLASHWKSRYLQIGYGGVEMMSPAHVAAGGVTVATLHQVRASLRCCLRCWSTLLSALLVTC